MASCSETPTLPVPARPSRRPTVPWKPPRPLLDDDGSDTAPERAASGNGWRIALPPTLRPWIDLGRRLVLGSLLAGLFASLLWWADTVRAPRLGAASELAAPPPVAAPLSTGRRPGRVAGLLADQARPRAAISLAPIVITREQQPSSKPPRTRGVTARAHRARQAEPTEQEIEEKVSQEVDEDLLELHGMLPELTLEDVREVVAHQQSRLRQCYSRALRRAGQGRDVRLRMTVDIAPTGEVASTRVPGSELPGLASCLKGVTQRWRFPPSRSGAQVPIPLAFTTAD